jgi:hypothetical protein
LSPRLDWRDAEALQQKQDELTRAIRKAERITAQAREAIAAMNVLALDLSLAREEINHELATGGGGAADFEQRHEGRMRGVSPNPEVSKR